MDKNALLKRLKDSGGTPSAKHPAAGATITLKCKSGYEAATMMGKRDETDGMKVDGDAMKRKKVD
jgi:hypothetical protein